MNGITKINSAYEHSQLVNNPPFITNYPLIETIETRKKEFKKNEYISYRKEYTKEKTANGLIWTGLLGIPVCACLAGANIYKKTKNITNKIKAALKSS